MKILKQTSYKKLPRSTSDLQLYFLRLIININLKNFRKFISQERHIRILIKGAHCFFFKKTPQIKIMFIIVFYVLRYNLNDEKCLRKAQKVANFDLLRFHHLKFQIPRAWG